MNIFKEPSVLATAKIFQDGQSQTVRLPEEFQFEKQKEVFIKKINGLVVLIPKSDKTVWDAMFDSLNDFSDDFMPNRSVPGQKRENLF